MDVARQVQDYNPPLSDWYNRVCSSIQSKIPDERQSEAFSFLNDGTSRYLEKHVGFQKRANNDPAFHLETVYLTYHSSISKLATETEVISDLHVAPSFRKTFENECEKKKRSIRAYAARQRTRMGRAIEVEDIVQESSAAMWEEVIGLELFYGGIDPGTFVKLQSSELMCKRALDRIFGRSLSRELAQDINGINLLPLNSNGSIPPEFDPEKRIMHKEMLDIIRTELSLKTRKALYPGLCKEVGSKLAKNILALDHIPEEDSEMKELTKQEKQSLRTNLSRARDEASDKLGLKKRKSGNKWKRLLMLVILIGTLAICYTIGLSTNLIISQERSTAGDFDKKEMVDHCMNDYDSIEFIDHCIRSGGEQKFKEIENQVPADGYKTLFQKPYQPLLLALDHC